MVYVSIVFFARFLVVAISSIICLFIFLYCVVVMCNMYRKTSIKRVHIVRYFEEKYDYICTF